MFFEAERKRKRDAVATGTDRKKCRIYFPLTHSLKRRKKALSIKLSTL